MYTTFQNVIALKLLETSHCLTQEIGLNNKVLRISVFDCPLNTDLLDSHILEAGDLFISSLYAFKDHPENLIHLFTLFVESKASGLLMTDEYFDSLPPYILEYCVAHSFPIAIINHDIPYATIIKEVMEHILISQSQALLELTVSELIHKPHSIVEIKQLLALINPFLENTSLVLYIKECHLNVTTILTDLKKSFNLTASSSIIPYKSGILILISYNDPNQQKVILNKCTLLAQYFQDHYPSSHIGISRPYHTFSQIREAITEALLCSQLRLSHFKNVVSYHDLESFSLLLRLQHDPELETFMNKVLDPIKDYDTTHSSGLLPTLIEFVNYDGDYKLVAQTLYQHENTIRYRINKVRTLLGFENSQLQFYEHISLAVKIYHILTPTL